MVREALTDNPLLAARRIAAFPRDPRRACGVRHRANAGGRSNTYQTVAQDGGEYDWDTCARPLEDLACRLNRVWSPVGHLNAVVNTPELREAYNACLPLLSAYASELGQNERLYRAYQAVERRPDFSKLAPAQKKIVENALRDFRLSGVALGERDKARYREVVAELALLTARFEQNLLDATQAWSRHVEDEQMLAGLPPGARAMAEQSARQRGMTGWVFTLEYPSYLAVDDARG